jgi:hypothetical protein
MTWEGDSVRVYQRMAKVVEKWRSQGYAAASCDTLFSYDQWHWQGQLYQGPLMSHLDVSITRQLLPGHAGLEDTMFSIRADRFHSWQQHMLQMWNAEGYPFARFANVFHFQESKGAAVHVTGSTGDKYTLLTVETGDSAVVRNDWLVKTLHKKGGGV